MKLQQVRYFLALCEERNFTRAARRCGVAQPSLTRAIQILEQEFGGILFHRADKALQLSPLGQAVQPLLRQIDQAATAARLTAKSVAVWPVSQAEHAENVPTPRARWSGRYRGRSSSDSQPAGRGQA